MTKRALLTASLLLLAAGDLIVAQEPTNQLLRDTRQHDRVLVPVLEVREFSGEFERWGREMTVNAPKAEVFRWSTPVSGTASATWTLLDGPPGSGAAVVGSGSAGSAPREGSVTVFRIDFRKFFPSGLPAGGTTYWVVLEPVDAAGQAGPASLPVQVTYANQAGQANIAAFAGREADIVAPTQMALSKTSKLAFLQALVAKSVELLSEDSDALVAATTDDIPDATVRLTPQEPLTLVDDPPQPIPDSVMTLAIVKRPHFAAFHRMISTHPRPQDGHATGVATAPRNGTVQLWLTLMPGQLYLLDIQIEVVESTGLELAIESDCVIDFDAQTNYYTVPPGPVQLLAVVNRPASKQPNSGCTFSLREAWYRTDFVPEKPFHEYTIPRWEFHSAELTELHKG